MTKNEKKLIDFLVDQWPQFWIAIGQDAYGDDEFYYFDKDYELTKQFFDIYREVLKERGKWD